MAEIKTIYKGESISLLFTFPVAYDMARLTSQKVFIGETEFAGVIDGQTVKLQLKSSDTERMIGTHKVVLWFVDTTLGLRKPYCGDLVVAKTQAAGNTFSVSSISDIIIPIVISETAVTVDDILYNYVKGDKGDPFLYADFTPAQIAELQQPAADAIASIEAVELSVEQAEALRVQAEIDRQTNTGTAIQNAQTATQDANTATDLALEVANHPDIIQNDYWYKWNTTTDAYETTGVKASGLLGWTPLYSDFADGARIVRKLTDYVGGEGVKPTSHIGEYLKADGTFTAIIADAQDYKGLQLASQAEAEANTENTKFMTALRVFQNFVKNATTYVFSALNTTSKTITGAINELFANKANKVQEAWLEPTLVNSWANSSNKAMFMKDNFGFVHCKGYIAGGAVGSIIFTFPAGYVPSYAKYSICNSDGYRMSYIYINYLGEVKLNAGVTTGLSLDAIYFKADS